MRVGLGLRETGHGSGGVMGRGGVDVAAATSFRKMSAEESEVPPSPSSTSSATCAPPRSRWAVRQVESRCAPRAWLGLGLGLWFWLGLGLRLGLGLGSGLGIGIGLELGFGLGFGLGLGIGLGTGSGFW